MVGPARNRPDQWLPERQIDGVWRGLRRGGKAMEEYVKWDFPAEEYGPSSGPSGVVRWDGGEQRFLCRVTA